MVEWLACRWFENRRAAARRMVGVLLVSGVGAVAAPAASVEAVAVRAPVRNPFLLGSEAAVCPSPGADVFVDGFEADGTCRWSVSSPEALFCPTPVCGDGLQRGGEVCDDGNDASETACAYGVAICTCCAAGCLGELALTGPTCGDGALDPAFESCDDGNTVTETSCPYGTASCSGCTADCETVELTGNICGDGVLDAVFETCDDGNAAACGTCDADCQTAQPATAATGSIVAVAAVQLADQETVVLDDGFGTYGFEFDFDAAASPGNVAVPLAGNETAGQVGAALRAAINAQPVLIEASSTSALVTLVHDLASSIGNQPIQESVVDTEFETSGLEGGLAGDCATGVGCGSGVDCASGSCVGGVCADPLPVLGAGAESSSRR